MTRLLTQFDKTLREDERETYLTLKLDLSWREGFGILFVQCTPVQQSWIIEKIKQDISDKSIDIIEINQSTYNLYDLIQSKTQEKPIDILLITGLEKPLEPYIKAIIKEKERSYQVANFPPLLSHLNWQRERFRDDFNLCLVFLVREYILKYLVRRAPDFFDWRSGVFKFPVDKYVNLLRSDNIILSYLNKENQVKNPDKSSVNSQELPDITRNYLPFLQEILEAEYESNSDPKVVYPILQRGQHLLDNTFAQLLQQWARNFFSEGKTEQVAVIAGVIQNLCIDITNFPLGSRANNVEIAITGYQTLLEVYTREAFSEYWAILQNNLGNAYLYRIRGERADNLELAIAAYNLSLEVYTCEAFPYEWARTQNNLGLAYSDRIRGERADNLELAIAVYNLSLEVYTREAFPQDWARTQNNLGAAYRNRIRGERADNLELAIAAYNLSLEVYTREAFPEQWATIQNNLATAYSNRIRGDKADNLEIAIACYHQALRVRTFDSFPVDWAETQNNIALAYSYRIRGDKADNLEMAIACYHQALHVRTFDSFPVDWAETQNNLATAYRERIRGDKADNLEMAITCYHQALHVRTFDSFSVDWAETQNNLATAYRERIRGDKADNLEMAIAYCENALKVRTFYDFPQDWAETQNNLANVYLYRIRGDKAKNLEMAIAYFKNALKVRTFYDFPQDWAETQNNLANAYADRIRGDRFENSEKAINCYHNALKIYTVEDLPLKCLETAHNLGKLHYSEKQWQPATEAYHVAIEAVENTLLEATNPQSRQETLSNAIDVFHRIVLAHLKLNQPEKALEYIEHSKARNLVELMTQKNVKPQGVSQEIIEKLDELRQLWVNEQIRLQSRSINQNISINDKLTPYISDNSHLREYRQAWEDFIDQKITPIDPNFKRTQIVEPIPFENIQALTDAETCLLQWYITGEKILAFVVSADGDIKYWESSEYDMDKFIDDVNNYIQLYYYYKDGKREWINQLPNLLQTFADTLHINDILALIPDTCNCLIIIPHRYLHILPIHAFPIEYNHILQDKYNVQYAPSCQLLQIQKQRRFNKLTRLLSIQNLTNDLIFSDLEGNIISTFFSHSEIISHDNATKTNVISSLKSSDIDCIHFSCHSQFNLNNPFESALLLSNRESLTLGEIFELDLKQNPLIVFSACETGLIDFQSPSDECLSISTACIFAGSSSVISSLWTVNDLATTFLMIKFYEILLNKNQQISVPLALNKAQNWLRNLTIEEFKQELDRLQPQISSQFSRRKGLIFKTSIKQIYRDHPYPFANPYYWAGFIATGV
ncbi:MAG: CHAT domain-containing protein [Woronichinia naegeliana WA131]|jgi:CHAT domain-containing protein/tetratricopeptide (TPR) repeat protein|uniref:CHAT domain-containing protein n=1 Tax=Woronichinia naegeliana WA131 TaxID=2824559 RepID=A0A977L0R0_9CYAN|nr:MAG: CHAT domain-containing protein [Woronichinia naegeliana WA131]